jgi:membrane protein DedA with SNARE-associated domain
MGMYSVLEIVTEFIIDLISFLGYPGIILAMAIESACIPLPSEVIMPFSGYLAYKGRFDIIAVSVAGAVGCVLGSILAYWVGMKGGKPLILRYGRYVLISPKEIELAERWARRYGDKAVFISRLMPVVRTFISLPAGMFGVGFPKFVLYTFLGSLPWCFVLAYAGKALGENWHIIGGWIRKADWLIAILILFGLALFLWKRIGEIRSKVEKG